MDSNDEWQASIIRYLCGGLESTSKEEVHKLRYRVSHYVLIGDVLYKRDHSLPFFRCLDHDEADYVLRKVYEGVYGNYFGGRSLSHNVLRQGYYWPSLARNATQLYKKCD